MPDISLRDETATTVLAARSIQALADHQSSARRFIMPPSIRRATPTDLPEMADLLIRDAEQRRSLEPSLWRLAADARARIESVVGAGLDSSNASARELWHVAEASGRIVGIAHAMVVPVPPIYGAPAPPHKR